MTIETDDRIDQNWRVRHAAQAPALRVTRLKIKPQHMVSKTDIPSKTKLVPDNIAAAKDRRPLQFTLDRIDELQDFYDFSPVAYLSLDVKGQVLNVNLTGAIMMKVARLELIGQSFYNYVVREDRDILYLHLRRLFLDKKPQSSELRLQTAADKKIHVATDSIYVEDRKGRQVCRTVLTDITHRVLSARDLRASEERLRIAVEGGQLGTWNRDLLTGETYWNRNLYDFLGRDPERPTISGETFFEYIHPDDIERVSRHLEETFKSGSEFIDEFRIIREDGEIRWLASSARLYRDSKGRPVRMAGVNYDVTDKKRMEKELQNARDKLEKRVKERTAELGKLNEELRKEIERREKFEADLRLKGEKILQEQNRRKYLSNKLIEILEIERQEMAHTLHDEVGQILTTINMDLDFVKQISSEQADIVVEEIEKVQSRIKISMDLIGELSRGLRPHVLDDLGLIPSLKSILQDINEKSQIECHFFSKNIPEHFSDNKAMAVYRIVQEALRNCIRHAQPKNIFVNLTKRGPFVLLTIEDDGIGFEYDNLNLEKGGKDKLGIMLMTERAVQVDGEFHIESSLGKGTQVIVEIPIE